VKNVPAKASAHSSASVVQARQRDTEQQAELGLMVQRPAAELAAGRDHLDRELRRHLVRRPRGHGGGFNGLADTLAQLGEDVGADVPEQLLVAVEVPVQPRRGHPHLAGDGPQRDRPRAALHEQSARGLDDLLRGRRAQPIATGRRVPGTWLGRDLCRLCHSCLPDPVSPSGTPAGPDRNVTSLVTGAVTRLTKN
jgi:hypothetical protein